MWDTRKTASSIFIVWLTRLFEFPIKVRAHVSCALCIAVLAVQAETGVAGSNGQIPQLNLGTGKQIHTASQGQICGSCIGSLIIYTFTPATLQFKNKECHYYTTELKERLQGLFLHLSQFHQMLFLLMYFQMDIDDSMSAALYKKLLEMEKTVRKKLRDEDVEHAKWINQV